MYRHRILIVDDDKLLQKSLFNILSEKYDATVVGSGEEALQYLARNNTDLVLLDIKLPGMDGVEVLKKIREQGLEVSVIMMTAFEDVKTVITSMKMGAFDYLVKPLDIEELEVIVEKALENTQLRQEVKELRKQLAEFDLENIIGNSAGMKQALQLADKIARSYDTTALIEGETGTGKEVIAKVIHYRSARSRKPFISINCGAISKDLVESELFGYEKGAFTGSLPQGKKGKCEIADQGTLFLDEISELALSAQVKLLRFLEEREFYPVGATEKKKVDVRIIAATNKPLERCMRDGAFREDLYYRLNVAKIILPPLRERQADIIPFVDFFLGKFNEKFGKNFRGVSPEAERFLLNYRWEGNVREIKNTVERIVLLEEGERIERNHLSFLVPAQAAENAGSDAAPRLTAGGVDLVEINKSLVFKALEMTGGNKAEAAKLLGISRPTLVYRLNKYRSES
ncbi:MAG: sigma-54 dependent transcriptional regulator [Deltaproteobacteria bacterium]|jgi:DNA-binding NtrC family response regulator|nr:sigma-54-dependent Fis family transcriptional regulator [Syntrophaceae bacterium]